MDSKRRNFLKKLGLGGVGLWVGPLPFVSLFSSVTKATGFNTGAFWKRATTKGLFAWGLGSDGQLGLGSTLSKVTPTKVDGMTNWSFVSGGGESAGADAFVLAVKTDGGGNENGKLGDGTSTSKSSPIQVGALTNWSTVSAGHLHSLAVKTNGTLWAWGYGAYGQHGNGVAFYQHIALLYK